MIKDTNSQRAGSAGTVGIVISILALTATIAIAVFGGAFNITQRVATLEGAVHPEEQRKFLKEMRDFQPVLQEIREVFPSLKEVKDFRMALSEIREIQKTREASEKELRCALEKFIAYEKLSENGIQSGIEYYDRHSTGWTMDIRTETSHRKKITFKKPFTTKPLIFHFLVAGGSSMQRVTLLHEKSKDPIREYLTHEGFILRGHERPPEYYDRGENAFAWFAIAGN